MDYKVERGLWAAGVMAVTVAVFAVNVRNRLLRFDDLQYIVKNRAIADGLTPRSVWWSLTSAGYADNWHPLTWMSHALDNTLADGCALDWRVETDDGSIFGETQSAAGRWNIYTARNGFVADMEKTGLARLVHGENVLLHGVNAALLFWLILLLLAPERGRVACGISAAFALLWALHPLRVEVVAWAAERKELLSVLFMLLTLIFYIRPSEWWRSRIPFGDLSVVCFVLALMAKPVAVSLPAVILAYDWIVVRRSFREALSRIVPFAALAAVACYLTMISQTVAIDVGRGCPLFTRLLCVVEAPIVYLFQTLWPVGLAVDYPFPDKSSWPLLVLGALLLLAMAGVAGRWLFRPGRWTGLGCVAVAWLYVGLLPMIGVVGVGFEPHSDRYTYWIGCGASACAAVAVCWLRPRWWRFRRGLCGAAGLALVLLAALAVRQSLPWRDTISLFVDTARKTKGEKFVQGAFEMMEQRGGIELRRAEDFLRWNLADRGTARARAWLAMHLAVFTADDRARTEEALAEAERLVGEALAEDPKEPFAHATLGYADYRRGRYRSAYAHMKKAMDLGYVSHVVLVDEDDWKAKAKAEEKGAADVQR